MRRGHVIRLYPTAEQARLFARSAGCKRAVFNAALEQSNWARETGRARPSYARQNRELKELKRTEGLEWLGEVHSDVLQSALRDLAQAFENFFEHGRGFPKFKRRGEGDSFRLAQRPGASGTPTIEVRKLNRHWVAVKVPKAGWVKGRATRMPKGRITNVTISRGALGWQAALAVDDAKAVQAPLTGGDEVGLDRGVTVSVATSDGEMHHVPQPGRGEQQRRLRLERRLARQQRGSRRRERTRRALARVRAKDARRRRDALHKITTEIAERSRLVVIENLDVQAMTSSARGTIEQRGTNVAQKAGLNRAILAQGWGQMAQMLDYKLAARGGTLIRVPAAYTSQTCSQCAHTAPENRESQAVFRCRACGHTDNADTNAARNILRAGQTLETERSAHAATLALEQPTDDSRTAAGQAVAARGALCDVVQGDEPRTHLTAAAHAA